MRKMILALLLIAAPASAGAMTISQFLAKADALQKKGALALFSSDLGRLKSEVTSSSKELRAEHVAARKAGRRPPACLPEKASVNSKELMDFFRALPPAQRNASVKSGLAALMARKYPCPA